MKITGRGAALEQDIAVFAHGIDRVMHQMGMIRMDDSQVNRNRMDHNRVNRKPVRTSEKLFFRESGFFRSLVSVGQQVRKGEILGQVTDVRGLLLETIYAPCAGEIWAVRTFSSVYTGNISFLIGVELEL